MARMISGSRGTRRALLLIVILFGTSGVLWAQVDADTSRTALDFQGEAFSDTFGQEGFWTVLLRTLISLIIIVGLVYLSVFGLKRYVFRNKRGGGLPIRVLGSSLLGPKKMIYLVEIEDRRLVLGVTDASISTLAELEKEPGEAIKAPGSVPETQTSGGKFRNVLDTLISKRSGDV